MTKKFNRDRDRDTGAATNKLMVNISKLFNIDMHYSSLRVAGKIAGIYLLIGLLWILFSDQLLRASVNDEDTITFISMIKGWIYVILSAIIIFLLIARSLRKIRTAQEELEKQNIELKAYQEKLQYNAYHDSLTGLPN
jgi:diguanylate cyclase